jgi:hypothetical protein
MIEGREWPKPWDPACPICRSPWLVSIDEMLAEGYTFTGIRAVLRGRTPGPPSADATYRAHIDHLAEPHRKLRAGLEERAEEGDPTSLVDIGSATQAVITRGFAALAAGKLEVTSKDLIAALRLQSQLDKADGSAGLDASSWQAAFVEFLTIVRQHMPAASWQSFVADVHASPTIRLILAESPALPQGAPHG